MINNESQKQTSGDNSINIQANGDIILAPNKEVMKAELLQIFFDNYPNLRKLAQEEANQKAKELTNEFIQRISQQEEKILKNINEKLSQPNMQMAVFEAQKGYAKYGNKEKLDRLAELLVDKSKQPTGSLKDILLDEAIEKISKMTTNQLNILSYRLAINIDSPVYNLESFKKDYIDVLLQFYSAINKEELENDIQYLMQIGCIKQFSFSQKNKIIEQMKDSYAGLFAQGFSKEELINEFGQEIKDIIIPCLTNGSLWQISTLNKKTLEEECGKMNMTQKQKEIISKFFKKIFSDEKIKEVLKQIEPKMEELLENKNKINNYDLMPLGTLIALKNYEIVLKTTVQWNF